MHHEDGKYSKNYTGEKLKEKPEPWPYSERTEGGIMIPQRQSYEGTMSHFVNRSKPLPEGNMRPKVT